MSEKNYEIGFDEDLFEAYISYLANLSFKVASAKINNLSSSAFSVDNDLWSTIKIFKTSMTDTHGAIREYMSDLNKSFEQITTSETYLNQKTGTDLSSASDIGLSSGSESSASSYSSSGSDYSSGISSSNYDNNDDGKINLSNDKRTDSKNEYISVEDLEKIVEILISLNITKDQFGGLTKVDVDKDYYYVIDLNCMNKDGKWKDNDITKYYIKDGKIVACLLGDGRLAKRENGKIVYSDSKDKVTDEFIATFLGMKVVANKTDDNKVSNNTKKESKSTTTSSSKNTTNNKSADSKNSNSTVKVTGANVLKGNVINTDKPVGIGTKYNLSDDQLARLACVAQREQGSVEGAKVELSLMANLYEKYKKNYDNVLDYVYNSGWFASGATNNYQYPGDAYVAAAREVINNGKRYLASNVVEHDYLGDLVYNSTGNIYDKSSYIPGKTVLQNQWGAKYVFVGFAPNGGDPFGYLIN